MKSAILILIWLACACVPCRSQTLDQFGGLTDRKCMKATGWFHTEKLNDRWWLCTPAGNVYWFIGVGAMTATAQGIGKKYGDADRAWGPQQLRRIQSWNFNGVGELSTGWVQPVQACSGCPGWPGGRHPVSLPMVQTLHISNYASVNLWNYASRPMKNMLFGMNGNYRGWRASIMDFFDPQYGVWLKGFFANDASFQSYKTSPWFVGIFLDDTDWFWGMGAGPDFHTVPPGHTNSHVGYMVLITSPLQTFNPDPAQRGVSELYVDTKVYSKTAMASPPANCSVQTPCSLRGYLYKKYNGSIAALNSAWGSNYTTFDSTGAQVTGELIGTGDGSTTVYTHTLAKTPVSPLSMLIRVAGTPQGGDCPWWNHCNIAGPNAGSISGPSGTTLAAGSQPWLSDFHWLDCGGCRLPAASYWVRIVYHTKPGSYSAPSREVGDTRMIPNQRIVVTAPAPHPNATGWDVYVSCENKSAPGVNWCSPEGQLNHGHETLQVSNLPFTDGQGRPYKWEEPASGLVAGSPVPSQPSFVNYSNGQIQVTFSSPPKNGRPITVDYVNNGWMYGTGLMDEDGRHTSWLGTNPICLSPATACDDDDYPRPNANANVARDLDAWISQFSSQYFGTLNTHLKAAAPHMLYFGADTVGTWGVPPRKEILQGAGPHLDGVFTQWFANQPDSATGAKQFRYLTQHLGDKPLLNFLTLHAQPDSAMSGFTNSNCCFGLSTQAARGQQWSAIINAMLNTPGFNGSYQWVGAVWWGLYDFTNELIDWGLVTPLDNAYDGHEAVTSTAACSPPLERLACGGEKRNYGDVITPVKEANRAWIQLAEKTRAGANPGLPK